MFGGGGGGWHWDFCPGFFVRGGGGHVLEPFKLSRLSYYVCCCYGISVHEDNYDTSRRQKGLSDHKKQCKSLQ